MRWFIQCVASAALSLMLVAGCNGPVAPPDDSRKPVAPVPVVVPVDPVDAGAVYAEFAVYVRAGQFRNTDELVSAVNMAKKIGRLKRGPEFDAAFPAFAQKCAIIDDKNRKEIADTLERLKQ